MARQWTEEQKAEASRRMKERQATKQVRISAGAMNDAIRESWDAITAEARGAPAILPEWRQAPRLRGGHRSFTMLRPVCRICERLDNAPRDWWRLCSHDPFVTMVPHPEIVRDWEDEVVDGVKTGRRLVKPGSERQVVSYEPRPNHTNRSVNGRSNGGYGLAAARFKGCIFPEELRSPHYPNGIANTCEFHDCRKQTELKEYQNGRYCRQEEAALVYFDETGTPLEVGLGNSPYSRNQRAAQLAGAPV
jgi:hypothetical protein